MMLQPWGTLYPQIVGRRNSGSDTAGKSCSRIVVVVDDLDRSVQGNGVIMYQAVHKKYLLQSPVVGFPSCIEAD